MAIVKMSGIGPVAISGKIQGTVFLSNNVVRVWHKTKKVSDSATNLVHGIFSGISAAYKTLSSTQLLAWQNAAVNYLRKNALAESRQLTANQAFQRVNNILTSLGLANVVFPPGVAVTDSITALAPAATAGAATFTVGVTTFGAAAALPANTYARVYATPQYTASKQKFSKSNFRLIGDYAPATAINPLDIKVKYVAAFGNLVAGQRIGIAIELVYYQAGAPGSFKLNTKILTDVIVAA